MMRASLFVAVSVATAAWWPATPARQPQLFHYEATRLSMACVYAIDAYGPDAGALPRILDEAFDEVDRIDRLMSHYKADSPLSRINRDAARMPVTVDPELFAFITDAMRYSRDSGGAFDITVGPLMKAWGFFGGEGRMPSDEELGAARHHVGGTHVHLNPSRSTIAFDRARRRARSRRHRQGLRGRSRRPAAATAADRRRVDQRRRQHDLRSRRAARPRRLGRGAAGSDRSAKEPRSPSG